jgi:hypothetical protein
MLVLTSQDHHCNSGDWSPVSSPGGFGDLGIRGSQYITRISDISGQCAAAPDSSGLGGSRVYSINEQVTLLLFLDVR